MPTGRKPALPSVSVQGSRFFWLAAELWPAMIPERITPRDLLPERASCLT